MLCGEGKENVGSKVGLFPRVSIICLIVNQN
jgi:hypothetical protein